MDAPVIGALIASGVAAASTVGGWAFAIHQTHRNTRIEHQQWRRKTRRDAYADLATAFQKVYDIFSYTPLDRGLEDDCDEYVTPQMRDALMDLRSKAIIVRFEGPQSMRDLAINAIACGTDLSIAWSEHYSPKITDQFENELSRAYNFLDQLIIEAESILKIQDESASGTRWPP
ncbi:hypothetical protein [Streptomyces sp. NPDC059122]|uniref:hypothetical protein n=1 Tax=Streptomyces sp. NPDC059122 TaxID=3346732 RepID=UPI0036BD3F66